MEIQPIAHIYNDFSEKFALPRQSCQASHLISRIVMEPAFRSRDAFRGIEMYSRLWLIWEFDVLGKGGFSPTVRPPRLGGNERLGVFATRSPNRVNRLGMTNVELLSLDLDCPDAPVLTVGGADIKSGTAIFDIKPYLPYADSHPDERCDMEALGVKEPLKVVTDVPLPPDMSTDQRLALMEVLSLDPRPAYHDSAEKSYGMSYGGWNIRFKVSDGILTITQIDN